MIPDVFLQQLLAAVLAGHHLLARVLPPPKMLTLMIPQCLTLHELLTTGTALTLPETYMIFVVEFHHINMVSQACSTDLT